MLSFVGLAIVCLTAVGQNAPPTQPVDETGWTPLMKALHHGEKEKALQIIEQGADVNARGPKGSSMLRFAASLGDIQVVQQMLAKGADAKKGGDAVVVAAEHGRLEIIKLLVVNGADINYQLDSHPGPEGHCALLTSAANGQISVLKYLLESGAKMEVTNKFGNTPLMETAKHPQPEALQLLIAYKANVNAKTPQGHTALIYAGYNGQVENLKILLAAGADPKATANEGLSDFNALDVALEQGHPEAVEILKQAGVKPALGATDDLINAARSGQLDMVKMLISKGSKVDQPDRFGRTALYAAVMSRQKEVVQFLLDEGANPNGNPDHDGSPLAFAATQNDLEIIKLLLAKKADPNAKIFNGMTSKTALAIATERGQTEIVELLKNAGAISGNEKPPQPADLLFMAVNEGNVQKVKSLLEKNTSPNVYGPLGWTPLLYALNNRQPTKFEIAKLLIEHGADVNDPGKHNNGPPLVSASGYTIPDDPSLVRLMIEKGAKVNEKSSFGYTALMSAAGAGNTQILRLLLEKGADVTLKDEDGNTALSIATKQGHAEIVRLLKVAGAKE